MGGNQSTEREVPSSTDETDEPNETNVTEQMQEALAANTYYPGTNAKYPFYLIQLSDQGELPYGDNGLFISDCIAAYIKDNDVTHIIVQTHGWNTPPDKAVAVAFTEFMGGMQNDSAMPQDGFNPIWVAFIWPAVPYDFFNEADALTRAELLINSEESNNTSGDSDILDAAKAAKVAIENENPDDEEFAHRVHTLAEHSLDDDADDDVDGNDVDSKVGRAKETPASEIVEGVVSTFSAVLRPLQNLAFGRLMKRGRICGKDMGKIIGKFMNAAYLSKDEGPYKRPKVSFMSNSLGAHCIVGALSVSKEEMPYKMHTVYFIQGAISTDWFSLDSRYQDYAKKVAGATVATFSSRDFLLKNVFTTFHGDALGYEGFRDGNNMAMKALDVLETEPYELGDGEFTSVDSSEYIDEGNAFAGGHGDFKEDETTTLYWNMINQQVDESAYDF